MKGSYLGPSFTKNEIKDELNKCEAIFYELNDVDLIDKVATELSNQKAIGWMQGRMGVWASCSWCSKYHSGSKITKYAKTT